MKKYDAEIQIEGKRVTVWIGDDLMIAGRVNDIGTFTGNISIIYPALRKLMETKKRKKKAVRKKKRRLKR